MRTPSLLALATLATLSTSRAQQIPDIDTLALRAHTHFLADDLLRGRATGSEGARIAALYIASTCQSLGLRPVNDHFLLALPLEAATIEPTTAIVAGGPSGTRRFAFPVDFVPNVGTEATLRSFRGPAVYVGSEADVVQGLRAGLSLEGAVAVTWGPVAAAAADTLRSRGVVGALHLIASDDQFALYQRSRGPDRYYHRTPTRSSFLPTLPSILAGPAVTQALLTGQVRQGGRIAPGPLGWSLDVLVEVRQREVPDANVACVAPGSGAAADTAVAFTAHYDHLGVSAPDEAGDSIYNGFSDDAAGVAMLLAIAASRRAERPEQYSRLFLFFSGEERGLLGSDYYVSHPAWPLERLRAVINLDAGAPPGRPVSWHLAGVDTTGLGGLALGVARAHGWDVTTSPARANSDYYPFAREGVPALFIIPGSQPYEGLSAEESGRLRGRWDHYHQAGDEWAADFPFGGLARYAAFALLIANALDDARP